MGCGDRSVTFIEQYQNINQPRSSKLFAKSQIQSQTKGKAQMLINCRNWTTSPQTQILFEASLSCTSLKTNEAVTKMIIKGRSPTMRHVSRTHRAAFDWLFDRINLDPKIPIQYVDTKNQLADMLTTRYEWDHLLRLLNIMNFPMFSCSHFLSNRKQSIMSKRAQESTSKEGSAVAKPRPMILVSRNLLSAKKDPLQDSSDRNSPGNHELGQSCVSSRDGKLTRNINPNPTMHSQERQQDDTQSSSTRICFRVGVDLGCQWFVRCVFLGMLCDCSDSVPVMWCNAFLERLLRAEWDGPFETTFWSLGNLRLPALHGVVPRGYISWTNKDQNEGSRVEIFSALRRSAQELLKALVDDAKGPPIVASPNSWQLFSCFSPIRTQNTPHRHNHNNHTNHTNNQRTTNHTQHTTHNKSTAQQTTATTTAAAPTAAATINRNKNKNKNNKNQNNTDATHPHLQQRNWGKSFPIT